MASRIWRPNSKPVRGRDRGLFLKLAGCDWIRQRQGLVLTGPAGVGKSWLACALGHKACREDFSVAYHRAPRLFPSTDIRGKSSRRSGTGFLRASYKYLDGLLACLIAQKPRDEFCTVFNTQSPHQSGSMRLDGPA